MTYGDPRAGNEYDDEYYRQSYQPPAQNSGRASVPSDDYGYDYSSSAQPDYGQYSGSGGGYGAAQGGGYHNGYGDQGGYGQAPVNPPVSPAAGRAAVGSAAVGSAAVGSASVGAASGRASVGASAGRASVGGSAGRATVGGPAGRASVRPAGLDDDVDTGPGRGGKAGAKGARPAKKKKKMLTIVLASVAVLIMLAGGGMIAFTSFLSGVPEPGQFKTQENTLIYAAGGTKQVAQLGTENRRIVPPETLDKKLKDTLIAGEDKQFYEHDGIDLWGIARAAWNNLTGGSTQGASTITQQYARAAADDLEVTYARKLREAVWARELEKDYTKDQILGFYINTAYFGRGATGVGAAAKAYFGVEAEKLSLSQAALLGAVLKQPEKMGDHKGYDPQNDPVAAEERWNYVLNNLVEMRSLSQAEVDKIKSEGFPKTIQFVPGGKNNATWGIKGTSTGPVMNYVKKEMETPEVQKALKAIGITDWKNGGLKITLTINPTAQAEMEKRFHREYSVEEQCKDNKTRKAVAFKLAEDGKTKVDAAGKPLDLKKVTCRSEVRKAWQNEGSLLKDYKPNVTAAGVSIDPTTGAVLAYYGGMDGTAYDKAGKNSEGTEFVTGGHAPASSFKIYTLAAAIENGISVDSHWDPTPFKPKGSTKEIRNAGRDGADANCDKNCSLALMAQKSYNVPFYKVTEKIGPGKVVEMAAAAGVTMMWDTQEGKGHDLTKGDAEKLGPNPFYHHVGFGQYPITVLDHASGIATFAANGVYNKPYFVQKVEYKVVEDGKSVWKPVPGTGPKVKGKRTIKAEVVNEVNTVLKNYGGTKLSDRESVSKSGTWQAGDKFGGENSSAWYVGYTPQIATAVWVGNYLHESEPIQSNGGAKIPSSGLPKQLWVGYMNAVDKSVFKTKKEIPMGCGGCIGDKNVGDGTESPTPNPMDCFLNPNQPGCEGQGGNGPGNGGNNPNPSQSPGWPNPNPSPSKPRN